MRTKIIRFLVVSKKKNLILPFLRFYRFASASMNFSEPTSLSHVNVKSANTNEYEYIGHILVHHSKLACN